MRSPVEFEFDEIGYWSEVKLAVIKEYATAYSTILAAQRGLTHVYIDGFAGAGLHLSRQTGEYVPGSPLNALNVVPPFEEFHLVDLSTGKASNLRSLVGERLNRDVFVYDGDCNEILVKQVFPRVRYEDFKRGLCILDPYGLHLDWQVIEAAGRSNTMDLFLNFPIMDMNRNALWADPSKVSQSQADRMTRFWGDESWRQAAYSTDNLFEFEEKTSNEQVVRAFRERLNDVANFKNVIEPVAMRNNQGGTIYYLFFASQNNAGNRIAKDIFAKYARRGERG